jgi:alpha-glucosidase
MKNLQAVRLLIPCPLTDLPVFVKAGGIVPMQNIIQSTNEVGDGILLINVWNGNEVNEFVYYEDDGLTYDNQSGAYYKRTISFDPQKRELVFGEVEGSYQSKYAKIQVVWHGFDGIRSDSEFDNTGEVFNITY